LPSLELAARLEGLEEFLENPSSPIGVDASRGRCAVAPTGMTSASCKTRRSAACDDGGRSPISSRKSVPRAVKVDVRVISATHRPLEELMERGTFRRDLYARLAGFEHEIPPLRDRIVDVGLLVAALLRSSKVREGSSLRFRGDAVRALLRYAWPLSVRELQQCLATSSVLAEEGLVRLEDLPPSIAEEATTPPEPESGTGSDEAIRRELMLRFAEAHGNLSEVARAMGKARQQVQRWARRFGIDADAFRDRGSE
jgi:transcriptional regulator of acetoin/glycerol metabolism